MNTKTNKRPFISIVIPVYNEREYITQCLDAIEKQSVSPDVVYIIDNNSTDRSIEIARSYTFVEIIHEPTQGICAATKRGLDVAAGNGGLILRLDADSRPNPDWVRRVTDTLSRNDSIVAVTGPGVVYDASPFSRALITILYMQPYFLLVGLALGQKPLFGSNFAIRAKDWAYISRESHLPSHQNIHDDIDISYHVARRGKIKYDHSIKMPISARPFRTSPINLLKRYVAGFRSIFIHWPSQAPWKRWV